MVKLLIQLWRDLAWSAGILIVAIAAALVVRLIVLSLLRRLARRKMTLLGQSLLRHGERPTRWIFPLLAVLAILPGLPLPPSPKLALEHITGLGVIAATAWLAILLVHIASDFLSTRYRTDVANNLAARRIQTQFQMLHRIVVILVVVVALAVMLMTFPPIKQIGESILASAGLASLVIGMAMKSTFSNLIAGAQIAFTQPFRLDDAVVVEGEWGCIEEIGTMYVVVRIWDLRRLVLPRTSSIIRFRTGRALLPTCSLLVFFTPTTRLPWMRYAKSCSAFANRRRYGLARCAYCKLPIAKSRRCSCAR